MRKGGAGNIPAVVRLIAVAVWIAGCSRAADRASAEPELPVSVRVELHPQIRMERPRVDIEDRLAAAGVRWLREGGAARLPVSADNPLRAAIRVDLTEDARRLAVDQSLRLRHGRKWPLEVLRTHHVPIPPGPLDLSGALESGLHAALALLARMNALFDLDDAVLVALVGKSDVPTDLRTLAVRILQDRDAEHAASGLLDAFAQAPAALRLTLIDALGTLGRVEEVPRLLAGLDGRRMDEISRALQSLALLGGDDARQFAGWIASGHPDERIQAMAREAHDLIAAGSRERSAAGDRQSPPGP